MNNYTSIVSGFRRRSEAEAYAVSVNKKSPGAAFVRDETYVDEFGTTRGRSVVVINEKSPLLVE